MVNYNSTIRWKEVELCGNAITALAAEVREDDSVDRLLEIKDAIDDQRMRLDDLFAGLNSLNSMADAKPGWRKLI